MNFDVNKVRSIIRGEVNGSGRLLVLLFCAASAWIGAYWLSDMARSASSALLLQQTRFQSLTGLAAEYRALGGGASAPLADNPDAMTIFTQVSARLDLGTRVTRIAPTPDGARCAVEVGRLYAEEMTAMARELAARGVQVVLAEVRALPAGQERLFTLSAVLEARKRAE
jgi:hypothetical protein